MRQLQLLLLSILVVIPAPAVAQIPGQRVPDLGESLVSDRLGPAAFLVDSAGSALIFQTRGPFLEGKAGRYRWFVIQDSAAKVVFYEPSGLKRDGWKFDVDVYIDIRAPVQAIEIGFATFNIWNEFTGAWFVTDVRLTAGGKISLDPRISPCVYRDDRRVCFSMNRHYTSIAWVSRVRLKDGTVLTRSIDPVLTAIRSFADEVKAEELKPDVPLKPFAPPDISET